MNQNDATLRNAEAIREALKHACYRQAGATLVTPYARFECAFVWLDQDVIHLSAAITKEDVDFALKTPELKIRFPYGDTVYNAPTQLLGIGLVQGRKTLRMQLPLILEANDYRESMRIERVGRVQVTFSSRKYQILTGKLVNVSPTGARILGVKEFEEGDIRVDDIIHITIPVTSDLVINCKAKVRNLKDQYVGLEFKPKLDGKVLESLCKWVFQKKAEAIRQVEEKAKDGPAAATELDEFMLPMGNDPIIALVGGTPELAQMLHPMLAGQLPLQRFSANVQTMRALAAMPGSLVLFYVASTEHDVRKRVRLLLEPLLGKVPVMLLGTTVENTRLTEMAREVKANSAYCLAPAGNLLFPRMVSGLLRTISAG